MTLKALIARELKIFKLEFKQTFNVFLLHYLLVLYRRDSQTTIVISELIDSIPMLISLCQESAICGSFIAKLHLGVA